VLQLLPCIPCYPHVGGHPNDITGLAVLDEFLYWSDNSGEGASLGRVLKGNGARDQDILSGEDNVGGLFSVLVANENQETSKAIRLIAAML